MAARMPRLGRVTVSLLRSISLPVSSSITFFGHLVFGFLRMAAHALQPAARHSTAFCTPSRPKGMCCTSIAASTPARQSEEHTSELQSRSDLVCRLLLEKKKKYYRSYIIIKKKKKKNIKNKKNKNK